MQMTLRPLVRIAAAIAFASLGAAQAQGLIGSYVKLDAQVIGPVTSPTLYSTHDLSAGDFVKWTQYFASREPVPWVADGEQTIPAGHTWRVGQLRMPPNTTAQWQIGANWTSSEPSNGAAFGGFRWHTDPMLKINFTKSCGTTIYKLQEKPGSMHLYTSTQLDGKMFFIGPKAMWCHDPQTNAPCAGWSGAHGWAMGTKGGVIPIPDEIGAPKGVCAGDTDFCRKVDGTLFTLSTNAKAFLVENRSWVPDVSWNTGKYTYSVNFNALHGSRIFMPRGTGKGLHCFDFETDAMCPGFPTSAAEYDKAYSVRFDPTRPDCLLMLGGAAIAYQLNVVTMGACSDPGSATEPKTLKVTPADHYKCDPASALVTGWDRIRVSPTMTWGGLQGLSEIKITLRDGNGNLLPASLKPNRTFSKYTFTLDISDVPYGTYPTLTVVYQMLSSGNLYSPTPVGVDVTWKGPPRQICFQTRAPDPVNCEANSKLTVTTGVAGDPTKALETIYTDKVLWSGAGTEGYAAAAAATSTRSLSGSLSSGESRTFTLQGRYDLKTFSGDVWSMGLTSTLKLDVANLVKASASVPASGASSRPMFFAKPDGSGKAGSMTLEKLEFSNTSTDQQAALNRGLAGLTDGKGTERVAYLRGSDGSVGFRTRGGLTLGPVVNSAPVVIPERAIAGLSEATHPGWTAYRRDVSRSEPLVIWGGNDGALHAVTVKADGLKEAWSFVPDVMLRRAAQFSDATLADIRLNPFFVDAQPMVGHANIATGSGKSWQTVAVVTYGRGARGIAALDVTKTDLAAGDGVLFEYTNTSHADFADLGYIVSPPISSEALGSHQMVKMSDGRWAVLVGNGVDSNDTVGGEAASGPGRPVLYALYLDGAAPRWRRFAIDEMLGGTPDPALATNNGLSTPRPVDVDGDGKVDLVYAGDIKGNLWRFDLKQVTSPKVTKLYAAGASRPIYTAPLVVRNGNSGACPPAQADGCWQVIVGTGSYLSPLQGTTNTTVQHLLGLLDTGEGKTVAEADLVSQPYTLANGSAGVEFRVAETEVVNYVDGKRGWKMVLDTKEQTVAAPMLKPNGQLRVTTVRPIVAGASSTQCLPARSWIFEGSPVAGPPSADTFDFNNDGAINEEDRVKPSGGTAKRPPLAMAIAGAQFSTPMLLLGPNISSSSAFMVFPSLDIDTSTHTKGAAGKNNPAVAGESKPTANGLAGTGDRKALGRASWRLVQ